MAVKNLLLAVVCAVTACVRDPLPNPVPEARLPTRPLRAWTVFSMRADGTLADWRDRCHAVKGVYFRDIELGGGGIWLRTCRLSGEHLVWPEPIVQGDLLGYWDQP